MRAQANGNETQRNAMESGEMMRQLVEQAHCECRREGTRERERDKEGERERLKER